MHARYVYIPAFMIALMVWPHTCPADASVAENSDALTTLLDTLRTRAGEPFDSKAGEQFWFNDFDGRSCTSCHTDSVFTEGRHERTGKVIAPMAPSANPERLTDIKKMNKWFKRNCKWTLGRECTAKEKGDVLTWLQDL